MSDHGQISGVKEVDLPSSLLQWKGRMSPGAMTGFYLNDPDEIAVAVVELARQPFTGLIFADNVDGALPWSLTGNGHPRGPKLAFTLRATKPDAQDDACFFPGYIEPGGGFHGGVNRGELSTVLAASGPAFRSHFVSWTPTTLTDIAPTLLHLLGLTFDGCEGRILVESLNHWHGDPSMPGSLEKDWRHEIVMTNIGGYSQHLAVWRHGSRAIIDCGWSDGDCAWREDFAG
ncbi:hypothetical protein AAIB41_16030 [Brucella sp. BE17]|uniref:hypothetical protein n=1 Tax=Brucella sp. BE17 TaxID=3142977 RepID=UPI0031BA7EB2